MKTRVLLTWVVLGLFADLLVVAATHTEIQIKKIFHADGYLKHEYSYYVRDAGREIKHGYYFDFYPDGSKEAEGFYNEDRRHGMWTEWHRNGRVRNKTEFENGFPLEMMQWDEQGTKLWERRYEWGPRRQMVRSVFLTFYPNGNRRQETIEEDRGGVLFTTLTIRTENGDLEAVFAYKGSGENRVRHGVSQWYVNGRLSLEENYDDGALHGIKRRYEEDGFLTSEENYILGKKHGISRFWSSVDRSLSWEEHYEEDRLVKELVFRSWDEKSNPPVWKETTYSYYGGDIYKTGKVYRSDGTLQTMESFKNDVLHGPSITSTYGGGHGMLVGTRTWSNYKDGLLDGRFQKSKYYYEASHRGLSMLHSSVTTGYYVRGAKCGAWMERWRLTERDSKGNVVRRGQGTTPTIHISCKPVVVYEKPPSNESARTILGRVTDSQTGDGLSAATVQIGNDRTATDEHGHYEFTLESLPAEDQYIQISFSRAGYVSEIREENLSGIAFKTVNASLTRPANVPQILAVESKLGEVFLEEAPVLNEYQVQVNWNGAEPGSVLFEVNGKITRVTAGPKGASYTFNMGTDFIPSPDPFANTIFITAVSVGGVQSPVWRLHPVVLPKPAWAFWWGLNLLFLEPVKSYSFSGLFPEPPIEEISFNEKTVPPVVWTLWKAVPFVGGKNFGLKQTQFSLGVEAKTDGSGTVQIGGQTGFEIAGSTLVGKSAGKGNVAYIQGQGLEWAKNPAEAFFGVEGQVKRKLGMVDLVPPLAAIMDLPVVGRVMILWSGNAFVEGTLTVMGGATFEVDPAASFPYLTKGQPEFGAGVGLAFSADIIRGIETELTGTGAFKIIGEQFPNLGVKKLEAELGVNLSVVIRNFKRVLEYKHVFAHPKNDAASPRQFSVLNQTAGKPKDLKPIDRAFAERAVYSRFVGNRRLEISALQLGQKQSGEHKLIENVFPFSQPAIALQEDKAAIVFVFFDPADSTLQANDIGFIWFDGEEYSAPATILNDTRSEFAPTIAFDKTGRLVAVWERVKDERFEGEELEALLPLLEVVYSVYDPAAGVWTEPIALSDNDHLDHTPLLRRGLNGDLLLFWQSHIRNELIGTVDVPTEVHFAKWDASNGHFVTAQTLPVGLSDVLDPEVAYDGTNALLVYAQDMDQNPATPNDMEIFYRRYNGMVWGEPVRLTNDLVPDLNPCVLYKFGGTAELVWLKENRMVRLLDWQTGAFEVIREESDSFTFADLRLSCDPQNRLIAYWQGVDEQNPDLFYSVYDVEKAVWSHDRRLTDDLPMEKAFTGAFAADGTLHMIYNKKNPKTETTDLYHLTYRLNADLAVRREGATVQPENPRRGEEVLLTCLIVNDGDVALENINVSFYLGDPNQNGKLLGTKRADPPLLRAGETAIATFRWTVPLEVSNVSVHAVVDPNNELEEKDEANNTGVVTLLAPELLLEGIRVEEHGNGEADLIAVIRNDGGLPAKDISVLFKADGTEVERVKVGGILSGYSAEIAVTFWPEVFLTEYPAEIEVIVDPEDKIREKNEENNEHRRLIYFRTDTQKNDAPDHWEIVFLGQLSDTSDSDDADNDGATDASEYLAGTDPLDSESRFGGAILKSEANVTITWPSIPGKNYQVQFKDDIHSGEWIDLGDPITASSTVSLVVDTPPALLSTRFYRVILLLPSRDSQ